MDKGRPDSFYMNVTSTPEYAWFFFILTDAFSPLPEYIFVTCTFTKFEFKTYACNFATPCTHFQHLYHLAILNVTSFTGMSC